MAVVLAYHAGFSWAEGGYLGVSVFFTLSGFLITSLLLAEHRDEGSVSLRAFWGRRFRRLLPASIVALVGICLFTITVGTSDQRRAIDGDIVGALGYVANWRFVLEGVSYGDMFAAPSPVTHFWSLAIEEQFYVIFPPLVVGLLALGRGRRHLLTGALAVLFVASVGASFLIESAGQDRIYFGTDTRAAELLAGALLAIAVAVLGRPESKVGRTMATGVGCVALVVLGAAVVTVEQTSSWLYHGGFAAIALVSSAAVFASARESRLGDLLGNPVLRWLGLRSYGLYLYHWPLFLWLDATRTGLDQWPLFALRMAATIAVAELSYHIVEMPFRRGTIPRLGMQAAAPLTVAAVLVAAMALGRTAPAPLVVFDETPAARPDVPVVETTEIVVLGGDLSARLRRMLAQSVDGGTSAVEIRGPQRTTCTGAVECESLEDHWLDALAGADVAVMLVGPGDPFAGDRDALTHLRGSFRSGTRVVWVTHPVTGGWAGAGPEPSPEVVDAIDLVNWATNDVARSAGDEVIDLARSVEPPPVGTPPVRVRLVHAAADPVLVSALEQVVDQVIDGAAGGSHTLRMLVVGDSIAQTLGAGIAAWGDDTGRAVVWNAARPGCSLLREGEILVRGYMEEGCVAWGVYFREYIRDFAPDVVLIHSGPWDLAKRRFDGRDDFVGPDDPDYDAFMRSEYTELLDILGSGGAPIVWMSTPCFTPAYGDEYVFQPERRVVQDALLDDLEDEGRLHLFDLEALACPGGEYDRDFAGFDDARFDGVHFSEESAVWITEQMTPLLSDLTGVELTDDQGSDVLTSSTS